MRNVSNKCTIFSLTQQHSSHDISVDQALIKGSFMYIALGQFYKKFIKKVYHP